MIASCQISPIGLTNGYIIHHLLIRKSYSLFALLMQMNLMVTMVFLLACYLYVTMLLPYPFSWFLQIFYLQVYILSYGNVQMLLQFTRKAASRLLRTIHIFLLQICSNKCSISNNLITKNQSCFRPGDSNVNQLIDLVNSHLTVVNRLKFAQSSLIFSKRLTKSGIRDCPSN